MTTMSQHAEWLSLIDISGPFLAEPVLKNAFPQGLEELDTSKRRMLRQAYDEWREALELEESDFPKLHAAWIDLVLRQGLELDEDGIGDVFKAKDDLSETLSFKVLEHGVTLRPDYAVLNDQKGDEALMLVCVYDPDVALDEALKGDGWAASPAERMVELCRATGVRLGLVTNGERWMFIDAPVGAVATFASWYARLWGQEPKTLQAFVNLLGIRRFFVDESEQLPALLDESLKLQDEVTDALGEQVRRAVEVLIQSLDRANVDRNYELLEGVEPTELYEAALTVMMRIVFLLSAEERGLLLMGDERYEANYAISTLRMQLRGESEEILERRWDAWSRLLAIFRAIYGGIEHKEMRLPALGGSLFDPDRFPFLEGRPKGSNWKTDQAMPLPIDNRTVLLLLDAVQLFQGRTLSYRALDVEQIGYVYEGLLERTVIRAKEVTLDLNATKNAKMPWVNLGELDAAAAKGSDAVSELLKERTGSSASRVKNDLAKAVDDSDAEKLLTACHGDHDLLDQVRPYFHFLRIDRWGYPLVYPVGTFMVTMGTDRRETGTHYTPKSMTEAIVKETLTPIVYTGSAQGKPREDWELRPPAELLDLKICDPAMGSGAFLVQVCRWLSERLVEAWNKSEAAGDAVTSEGVVVEKQNGHEPLRSDPEERLLAAKRLIAERCLYGVDANPLAVELAKLSIWLVTLAKGRPFGFLDHNLRCGDSLLGVHDLDQINYLEMRPGPLSTKTLFASKIEESVAKAIDLRMQIRSRPIRDIHDIEAMSVLDDRARRQIELPELVADALSAEFLSAAGRNPDTTMISIEAGKAMDGDDEAASSLRSRIADQLSSTHQNNQPNRRPFHWPLEFPEVFHRDNAGFDAIIGNPPFLGGKLISGAYGSAYQKYLVNHVVLSESASVDLVVHFAIRVSSLVRPSGCIGLIARRSVNEAKNRDVGLLQLFKSGFTPYHVTTNIGWPGKASVVVHQLHIHRGNWSGRVVLDGRAVVQISAQLDQGADWAPKKLSENSGRMFQGSILSGEGFKIDEYTADRLLNENRDNDQVVLPYLVGDTINNDPLRQPICWVICFWDWPIEKAQRLGEPFAIVERDVFPERQRKKPNGDYKHRSPLPERWWQYGEKRPGLYHAIGLGTSFVRHPNDWVEKLDYPEHVLAISTATTKYPSFTYLPASFIFSNTLCILADDRSEMFAVLSSDIHAVWAWSQRTTRQADMESMRYAHGNIFETFPFPEGVLQVGDPSMNALGDEFFSKRQAYMEANGQGLTKFYNDFHDPQILEPDLEGLRKQQSSLNETVVAAYGWEDIDLATGFHQVSYLPDGKNTRFTVSEAARNELVQRLALLNKERHDSENEHAKKAARKAPNRQGLLIGDDDLFSRREGTG